MKSTRLSQHPIHLEKEPRATVEPRFEPSLDWFASYAERHSADAEHGRLVTMHTFYESWGVWEMHPQGSEVVLCTDGEIVLLQEQPGDEVRRVELHAGEFAINEPGVWHTADVEHEATVVFITAGWNTTHRPRN